MPDIMTFGKGIASGYPLAGLIGTSEMMNSLTTGTLGGTYGGNAISSAAASTTIDILHEINGIDNNWRIYKSRKKLCNQRSTSVWLDDWNLIS